MSFLHLHKKNLALSKIDPIFRIQDANARASGQCPHSCLRSDGNVSVMNLSDLNVGVLCGDGL